jgi:hypothetical protein
MRTPPDLRAFRPEKESVEDYRERYMQSIPWEFQKYVCDCPRSEFKGNNCFIHFDGVLQHKCGRYTTLWTYLEYCASCDELYLIKKCPDRMMLCEDCGG